MDCKATLLIVAVILTGAISVDTVYAIDFEYSPPLQQQRDGVPVDAIQCNAPREMYLMNAMTPVCIFLHIPIDLFHQSFARTVYMITDAGEQEVHLEMYNSNLYALANVNSTFMGD